MSQNNDPLASLSRLIEQQSAPMEQWQPQHCGAIDIHISADGIWHHQGSAIKRLPLVQLFAKVLCREQGQYYLKTPVEKMAISVADAPLLIVDWRLQELPEHDTHHPLLICRDNIGREFIVGETHPLVLHQDAQGQEVPYLQLPHNVEAKISRAVFYAWAQELIETTQQEFMLYSGAASFSLGGLT
ncbi:DUF1285 domain-containing protein [Pseudoalteromonas sp. T1lg10]|uniref:DUF1285 domain-containing protein n=1 Tax=Pseudoalteromonas sp. T1lg10 TaxID=2077093 RepID=UPI000CF64412|nr:DUF1285 domain-containing protein [Pseudoalteromonas sp. T1lg10]